MEEAEFCPVKLNLRGTVFITDAAKFKRFPDSLLAKLTNKCDVFDSDKEIFFDRNPLLFHCILDAYHKKQFHAPKTVCSSIIQEELRFWNLNKGLVGKCCLKSFYQDDDEVKLYKDFEDAFKFFQYPDGERPSTSSHLPKQNVSNRSRLREKVWNMLYNPTSSNMAKVYFATIAMSVLLSVLVFALSTLPSFRQPREEEIQLLENITNHKIVKYMTTKQSSILFIIDVTTNSILAIDTVLCIYGSPNRLKTINWYNIGDILTILAVYSYNIIDQTDSLVFLSTDALRYLVLAIGIAYSFRILRILRLAVYTKGFLALYMSMASKTSTIFQFLVGFFFICLIAACVIYHAELFAVDNFGNLFSSMWWSVVTLSTVGYGDVVPDSVLGKSVSVFLIMTGLVLIAVPFVLVTNDYGNYCNCIEYMRRHEKDDCEKEKDCIRNED